MDRQYIDDQHVVARYLADQLPEDEREAFEAYYLEHPEMVQEIEAAARFKAGLMQLQERGDLTRLLKPKPWYTQWRYIAAAALAAVLVSATLILQNRPPAPLLAATLAGLNAGELPLIGSSHVIMRRRGTPVDAEVTVPDAGQAIELRVLPERETPDGTYRASLFRIGARDEREALGQLTGLIPAGDGLLTIYLDSAQVDPGDYELQVTLDSPANAANETSSFILRATAVTH